MISASPAKRTAPDLKSRAVARAPVADAIDSVTLDYQGRFLRRKTLTTDAGARLFVDLAETVSLDDGDAFVTTGGETIRIVAAPEALLEITARGGQLARLCWHIGNRHTPAQIESDRILIQSDKVMADMLAKLDANLRPIVARFTPERGASGHGRTHGHHHGPAEDGD